MKKLVALLAVLAVAAPVYAGALQIVPVGVSQDGNVVQITFAGDEPLGVGIIVECTGVQVAAWNKTDSFFDVFMDFASEDPANYQLGQGNPIADPAAAGIIALPASAVSLSAGHLETATDGSKNIAELVFSNATGSFVLKADPLRCGAGATGAVDAAGAMQTDLPKTVQLPLTPPQPTCKGDGDGDGFITIDDLNAYVALLIAGFEANGDYYFELQAGQEMWDFDADAFGTIDDLNALVAELIDGFNTNGDYFKECP